MLKLFCDFCEKEITKNNKTPELNLITKGRRRIIIGIIPAVIEGDNKEDPVVCLHCLLRELSNYDLR